MLLFFDRVDINIILEHVRIQIISLHDSRTECQEQTRTIQISNHDFQLLSF
jgi:hypothetical protein